MKSGVCFALKGNQPAGAVKYLLEDRHLVEIPEMVAGGGVQERPFGGRENDQCMSGKAAVAEGAVQFKNLGEGRSDSLGLVVSRAAGEIGLSRREDKRWRSGGESPVDDQDAPASGGRIVEFRASSPPGEEDDLHAWARK